MLAVPWTSKTALVALLVFVVGIGAIAVVLLLHLAIVGNVSPLFVGGRLAAPTGYINATAALMMMGALPSIVLASRREFPAPLRGLLLAFATAELQLALSVQSRGWLFTLPFVAIAAIALVPGRLRVTVAAPAARGRNRDRRSTAAARVPGRAQRSPDRSRPPCGCRCAGRLRCGVLRRNTRRVGVTDPTSRARCRAASPARSV